MQALRKIVSVNTADQGGGAERVAWDLFKGFQRRGLESWLVVGEKKTDDPRVLPLFASPHLDYRGLSDERIQVELRRAKARDAARGIEDFHFPYSRCLPRITGSPPDVVLCHNLHGGFFDLNVLASLADEMPVYLVLHDSWTMTGHCACPIDCALWQTGCGTCPDLSLPPAVLKDATHFNWLRKRRIFERCRLHVAAPTQWLLDRARASILAPAMFDSRVIPCGVDLTVFQPGDRAKARQELGIPSDTLLLVFAAHGLLSNPHKDFATIEAAVHRLARLMPDKNVLFVGLGEQAPEQRAGACRLCFLPFQASSRVAGYLQAADVYLHASKTENFGLVTAEAQACGTPVVATAVGGLPEVVRDGERGLLVPAGDAEQMARAIHRLATSPALRQQLGAQAAEHARRHWDIDRVVEEYLAWFAATRNSSPATARRRQTAPASAGPQPFLSFAGGRTMANEINERPRQHGLTEAEIAQFHEQGFLGPFTAFTPPELAPFLRIIRERVLECPTPHSPYRTELRHLDSQAIWRLCTAPAIVSRLRALYGPDLLVWYSNLFDKGPERPELQGSYPWHQDEMPFAEKPMTTLSAWLAVTPATVENGCVELIPGTHTRAWPIRQQTDAGVASWFAGREVDPSCFNEATKVAMTLLPGQFFLFDGRTLHHSNRNRTNERRIGLSFRVSLPSHRLGLPHPCLLLCGKDRHGVNALAKPPANDPSPLARPADLPDSRDYAFDGRLHGLGWHLPERDGESWFRWTGPEKDSWLELAWHGTGDGLLCCRVLHAVAQPVLESLCLRVNGHAVPLTWSQEGRFVVIQGPVPAELLATGPEHVRISFHVVQTLRPCDIQPGNSDTRSLGLAVGRISLTPVAASPPETSRWWQRIFARRSFLTRKPSQTASR